MISTSSGAALLVALALFSLLANPALRAQTVAPVAAVPATPAIKEDTILLNAFQVSADAADTYDATNTNSITGTNTALNKTPLDAKIFNRQLHQFCCR